jgi:hypothetical protein
MSKRQRRSNDPTGFRFHTAWIALEGVRRKRSARAIFSPGGPASVDVIYQLSALVCSPRRNCAQTRELADLSPPFPACRIT